MVGKTQAKTSEAQTSEVKTKDHPALNWVFTYNNYTPKGELQLQECELFKYIIYGHEVAPTTGTPHLQGYFQLLKKKSHTFLKKHLPAMYFAKEISNYQCNNKYCSKDATDIYIRGTPTINGTNTASLYKMIIDCKTWQDVLQLSGIERRMSFARDVFINKPIIPQEGVILRPWQQKVVKLLTETKPDDRHIYVVYDKKGGKGKTFISKYLYTNYGAYYISPSKSADLLYAYNGQDYIIYDIPRSCDEDYVNWGAIEKLKDGIFFSGKFASGTKYRNKNCHILIFTNNPIPKDKFSDDRIIYIESDNIEHYEDEDELIRPTLDVILKNKEASEETRVSSDDDLDSDEYDEIEQREQLPTHDSDFVLRFD